MQCWCSHSHIEFVQHIQVSYIFVIKQLWRYLQIKNPSLLLATFFRSSAYYIFGLKDLDISKYESKCFQNMIDTLTWEKMHRSGPYYYHQRPKMSPAFGVGLASPFYTENGAHLGPTFSHQSSVYTLAGIF